MKEIECFEKGVSPLNPPKSTENPIPSYTGENNENDSIQEKLIPNFQNQRKVVVKHFMSPTISAASKVSAPRKKILVDRNENSGSSDSQIHRISSFDPKRSPRNSSISQSDRSSSRVNLPHNGASESDNDGDANLYANSSLKSYDPLTNYLTPRPKYLRFDPNRRREVLNRLEIEDRDDLYGCFESLKVDDEEESSSEDVKDSSFSPLKESVVKQKIEENTDNGDENMSNDSEEETEEEEEDEGEDEEEFEEERGWCLRGLLKCLLTVIACLFSTSYICSMNSPTPLPTQQAIWGLKDGYFMIQNQTLDVVTMRTHDASFLAVEEGVHFCVSSAVEIDENDYVENKERVEVEFVEGDEVEFVEEDEVNSEGLKEELVGNENEDNAGKSDRVAENEGVVAGEFAQLIDVDGYEKEVEALNHGSNVDNAIKTEAAENEVLGGDKVESEIDSFHQLLVGVRTDESEDFGGHGLEEEAKEVQEQFEVLDDMDSVEEQIGSQEESLEVDEKGYDNEGEMEKFGLNTSIIIGVSVVSITLASIAFFYHSNKARSTSSAQQAQPVLEKETTPLLPPIEKKVEFFARPSFRPPMEEAPKELNHNINVPTVKLIGEIDVGELSSSLRSCGSKYEMMEFEESNTTSFFPKQSSVPQPFSSPTQPSPMEISTTSSHSHGSFTTEMKIVKKEGGKNGKAKIEVITPVRRSSRLRNRDSVMSSP